MKNVHIMWRRESVFAQASFQFCGHLDEYLMRHTRHLALLYMQTRFGKGGHLLRVYEDGNLVEERKLSSARPVPAYYGLWLWHWHRELRRFARMHEGTVALFEHPLGGVGQAFRRKVEHVFWQWDYFPSGSFVDRLFNSVARHCARTCARYIPLTDAIARAMGLPGAKPVMLGVTPPTRFGDPTSNRILMVGQLRGGQGIEHILDFIAHNKDYSLSLMGAAANGFEKEIAARIAAADMTDRVYFPNRFVTETELREEAAKCFVSLALYDTSPSNLTNYADPGKVKSSIEMGLPVVMTRISDIVPFVEKFKAGEVIDSLADLSAAVDRIRKDYALYQSGLRAFAEHFDCERYYAGSLIAVNCNPPADLVSSAHADKFPSASNDGRCVCGRVHPFAAEREQTVSDLGRVRVLAQELSAELVRTVQHGEGASVREASVALVAAAKRVGCFVPYADCKNFGDLKRRRSDESEIYAGSDFSTLVKVKDPTAKASIKQTTPGDWLYEHVIHNILFPETRYEFVGITEASGSVRIILRQKNIDTVSFPSEGEILAALRERGLQSEGRYFFGNACLAVTDVGERSDNVLLGSDGKVYFIDPLICLKKPAVEVIEGLMGSCGGKQNG